MYVKNSSRRNLILKLLSVLLFSFSIIAKPSFEVIFDNKDDDVIWSFDFISKSSIIFTQRDGKIGIYNITTKKISWQNVPKDIYNSGQAGLLDLKIHGDSVYLTYAKSLKKGATTVLAKATLSGSKLSSFTNIFTANASTSATRHFGSRIEIIGDKLFMTVGDRGERKDAQKLDVDNGKIHRLNLDGSIPKDNPFGVKNSIWTYGNRNPQGIIYDSKNKILYSCEFGPRGGDEINVIVRGKNYGWPIITYGKEYWGPSIGEGITHKKGMEQPLIHYTPSISPSGMTIFNGDLYLAALSGEHLRRVHMNGTKVVKQTSYFEELEERFRSVRVFDNALYASTDSGKILRIKGL